MPITTGRIRSRQAQQNCDRREVMLGREVRERVPREHLPQVSRQTQSEQEPSMLRRQLGRFVELDPRALDALRCRRDPQAGCDSVVKLAPGDGVCGNFAIVWDDEHVLGVHPHAVVDSRHSVRFARDDVNGAEGEDRAAEREGECPLCEAYDLCLVFPR